MNDEDSMSLSMAEQQKDEEYRARQAEIDKEVECRHLWVRNRAGRWCAYCGINTR